MRLYRWVLQLCPAAVRREYGAAMEEMFARRILDARRISVFRCVMVWLGELAGLFGLAMSERWGTAARARRRRERMYAGKRAGFMDSLCLEIRHAVRRLLRAPSFTLAAVSTLALAIAANVSIFAVVQRVLLNPLPYPHSDRLIEVDHGAERLNLRSGMGLTLGLYYHYAERAWTLDGIAIYRIEDDTLTGDGEPARVRVAHATPSLASVLRASAAHGRWFTDREGAPGAPPVAVLSDGLWMRRYGGDPSIIGRSIVLEGVSTQVVGVMPPSYAFPSPRVDLWVCEQVARSMGFGLWNYNGVARLRDDATIEGARAELNGLIRDLPQAYPADPGAIGNAQTRLVSVVRPLKEATIGGVSRALWILLASVALVFVVACANVANLFLVRSEARQRDVAVRRALGASRGRIARYFLSESALLAMAGGAAGLVLAAGAVRLLVRVGPATLPRLHEIRLDAIAVTFACVLAMVVALVFGAIPLWRRSEMSAALHESGRGNTASRRRHRTRQLLMGGQIALAFVLIVSAGLIVRSFRQLRALDPGFDASSVLTFDVGLPDRTYRTVDGVVAAHHAILDRVSALPGVTAVSASTCLPLVGTCWGNTLRVEGREYPAGTIPPIALFRAVAGGYFEAMGIRVVRGRPIDRGDIERHERVVVVNQALADRFFPNEDPIGRRVASNRPPARAGEMPDLEWLTVVGVVANTPVRALGEADPASQLYLPMSIAGGGDIPRSALLGPSAGVMSYVVRSATAPLDLMSSVRRAIDGVDADLAIARPRTLQDILDRASAQMAFTMVLLAIAAAVALVLGTIGVYGVMSYIVSQRTSEIGVRLALGAEPRTVAGSIVWQGSVVALAGLGIGLIAAIAGSRLIEALLYGIGPRDPLVFVTSTLTLLGVAIVACWLPARRAARVNPVEALRAE
jgi:putative ABC transport system permease protein